MNQLSPYAIKTLRNLTNGSSGDGNQFFSPSLYDSQGCLDRVLGHLSPREIKTSGIFDLFKDIEALERLGIEIGGEVDTSFDDGILDMGGFRRRCLGCPNAVVYGDRVTYCTAASVINEFKEMMDLGDRRYIPPEPVLRF